MVILEELKLELTEESIRDLLKFTPTELYVLYDIWVRHGEEKANNIYEQMWNKKVETLNKKLEELKGQ